MTAKDLNLSLDPGLLPSTGSPASGMAAHASILHDSAERVRSSGTVFSQQKPQWKVAVVVAVLNTAIILGAGYWFVELSGRLPRANQSTTAKWNQAIQSDLAELNIQLSALQDELHSLRLSQNDQQELLKSSLLEIQQQQNKPQKSTNLSKEKPAVVAKLVEDNDWYVNLGSFDTSKEAEGLRQKMLVLGYQPQINTQEGQNKKSHAVVLSGFKNRQSAEVAAKLLMEQTDLDSLWVSQGSEEG